MTARQDCRLDEGGRIDRSKSVSFTFNGKRFAGVQGDTLASALLANGVRIVNRSFKFHRPRGIFSAGVEEPNALMGVDVGNGLEPVTRATLVPLVEGLRAETQGCLPSLKFDVARVLDFTRALWPAGFYNKTFTWPKWHSYEWAIRGMAGLGHVPAGRDTTRYRHANTHCDVLVVGSGSAGLSAALEAARRGDDVLLVEQDTELGGSLLFRPELLDGVNPADYLSKAKDELAAASNVRTMLRTTVAGYYDHNVLTMHDRSAATRGRESVETFWKVRATRVVLATGAIEQPLMFGNNDLPGVMQAGAILQYTHRYGVRCGDNIVAAVNNDLAWRTIFALADAGITVSAIAEVRSGVETALVRAAHDRSIEVFEGVILLNANGSRGIRSLQIRLDNGKTTKLPCDALAVSGGFSPTVHLYSQAGGKLEYDTAKHCFVPGACAQQVEVHGAANGDFAQASGYNIAARDHSPVSTGAQWVDYLHDVTVSDLELAVRENFVSVEHLKRYTTAGMAVDQGKTSNLNALSVLGKLTNRDPGAVGTTTFRPPFMPVTMGAIAGNRRGDFYNPPRLLEANDWHVEQGAVFDDYGPWKRPAYYGRDRQESIDREVLRVRNSAGLFDGSPLGKIEVKGADAAEFLGMMYVNTVHTLKPGKVRYGLMLRENGVILDDGVFIRMADDHFLVNTTSGAADRIAGWMEEWRQCEYPHMAVVITVVTSQWSVLTVAGPRSRDIVSSLPGITDMSTKAFPHMSFAAGRFDNGVPYRIQRVSFSGEMSFELSVPSDKSNEYFRTVAEIGEKFEIGPVGIEAVLVLRTEKGFLHVGVDTDGMTNPMDVGFARIVANKKSDFLGARSLRRSEDQRTDRRQLVGIELLNPALTLTAGAHFVVGDGENRRSEGFVTTAYRSPTLCKPIGLGLIERGFQRMGEIVQVFDDGELTSAQIVRACFYDPDGEKMHA